MKLNLKYTFEFQQMRELEFHKSTIYELMPRHIDGQAKIIRCSISDLFNVRLEDSSQIAMSYIDGISMNQSSKKLHKYYRSLSMVSNEMEEHDHYVLILSVFDKEGEVHNIGKEFCFNKEVKNNFRQTCETNIMCLEEEKANIL